MATGVLIAHARQLYFFGDEWDFLLYRSISWSGILEPHNEHWSTLPLLVYRTLFAVFGIDHHLVYAAGPITLHALICVAAHHLMRRHGLEAWPAALATAVLAFLCGNLGENPLWAFQIGFLGSAAFGLLAIVIAGRPGDTWRNRSTVWVVTVAAMMCSGMALPLLVWLGWYLLLGRGPRAAFWFTFPPALVYLAWYAWFGRDATRQAPSASLDAILGFTATGLSSVSEMAVRLPNLGSVVVIALVAVALADRLPASTRVLAQSGLLACVCMWLLLGISRAGLGTEAATSSRYAYFAMLFTLPAVAGLMQIVSQRVVLSTNARKLAPLVALVVIGASGVAQTSTFATGRATATDGLAQEILGARGLIEQQQSLLGEVFDPVYAPGLTVSALRRPDVVAALPEERATIQGQLDASVLLQVASAASSLDLPSPVEIGSVGIDDLATPGSCSNLDAAPGAYLDLPPSRTGSQITVESAASTISVLLVSGAGTSASVTLAATPREPTFLATTSQVATLRVNLPAGPLRLCG